MSGPNRHIPEWPAAVDIIITHVVLVGGTGACFWFKEWLLRKGHIAPGGLSSVVLAALGFLLLIAYLRGFLLPTARGLVEELGALFGTIMSEYDKIPLRRSRLTAKLRSERKKSRLLQKKVDGLEAEVIAYSQLYQVPPDPSDDFNANRLHSKNGLPHDNTHPGTIHVTTAQHPRDATQPGSEI